MKLLYIEPIRLPTEKAHGIQIMEMCAAFQRQGTDVELVVTDREGLDQDPFGYYNIPERFDIVRLMAPPWIEGRLAFSIHVLVFAFRGLFYVRRVRPDVVYTRNPMLLTLLCAFYSGKVVWEVHGRRRIPQWVLKRITMAIPITAGLAEWCERAGMPKEKINIQHDAVNPRLFEHRDRAKLRGELHARLGIADGTPVALYLGSFGVYAWKGVDIAAAAAMLAPDIVWLFVGGSDQECVQLKQGASPNVMTLPRASRKDVPALLVSADMLLLPNKQGNVESERDTSPLKLFEYMATGIPLIASDLPSIREVLNPDIAYLVPASDPKALASSAQHIRSHREEAIRKASSALEVVQDYTWDKRAERILAALSV